MGADSDLISLDSGVCFLVSSPHDMSDERAKPFPFDEFETKWQNRWASEKTFRTFGPGEELSLIHI